LQRMLDDHFGDRMNYTIEIDGLLTIALAQRTLLAPDLRGNPPAQRSELAAAALS
jgi:hypothetical protein